MLTMKKFITRPEMMSQLREKEDNQIIVSGNDIWVSFYCTDEQGLTHVNGLI